MHASRLGLAKQPSFQSWRRAKKDPRIAQKEKRKEESAQCANCFRDEHLLRWLIAIVDRSYLIDLKLLDFTFKLQRAQGQPATYIGGLNSSKPNLNLPQVKAMLREMDAENAQRLVDLVKAHIEAEKSAKWRREQLYNPKLPVYFFTKAEDKYEKGDVIFAEGQDNDMILTNDNIWVPADSCQLVPESKFFRVVIASHRPNQIFRKLGTALHCEWAMGKVEWVWVTIDSERQQHVVKVPGNGVFMEDDYSPIT